MDTTRPIDVDRRFIVSYFLSDDTILVFEPPQRNSGIIGGKFLERRKIKKPDEINYYGAQVETYATIQVWFIDVFQGSDLQLHSSHLMSLFTRG